MTNVHLWESFSPELMERLFNSNPLILFEIIQFGDEILNLSAASFGLAVAEGNHRKETSDESGSRVLGLHLSSDSENESVGEVLLHIFILNEQLKGGGDKLRLSFKVWNQIVYVFIGRFLMGGNADALDGVLELCSEFYSIWIVWGLHIC